MEGMIVKVQRALMPRNAPALIYDQTRSVEFMVQLDADTLRKMGTAVKAYFEAAVTGETLTIGRRVADQPW